MIPLISTVLQDDGEYTYRLVRRSVVIINENDHDNHEDYALTKILSPRQIVEPEYSLTLPLEPRATYTRLLAGDATTPSGAMHTPTSTDNLYSGHFNPSHKSSMTLAHTVASLPTPWIIVLASMLVSLLLGLLAKRSNHPDFPTPAGFWVRLTGFKSFKARKVYDAERRIQKKLDKLKEMAEASNNQNTDNNNETEKTPERIISHISENIEQEEEQTIDDLPFETTSTTTTAVASENNNDNDDDNDDDDIFVSAPTSQYRIPNISTTPSNETLVARKRFFLRATISLLVTTWRSFLSLAILIYCCTKPSLSTRGPYPPPSILFVQIICIQLSMSNNHIPQFFNLVFAVDLFITSIAFVLSTTLAMDTYARLSIFGGNCPSYHPNCLSTYPYFKQIGCGAIFPKALSRNGTAIYPITTTTTKPSSDTDITTITKDDTAPFMELHTYEGAIIILGSVWLFTVAVYIYTCRKLLFFKVPFREMMRKPINVEKKRWSVVKGIAVVGVVLAVVVVGSSIGLHALHNSVSGKGAWVVEGVGGVVNVTSGDGSDSGSWSDCFWVRVEDGGMGVKDSVEQWRKADKGLTMIRLMGLV